MGWTEYHINMAVEEHSKHEVRQKNLIPALKLAEPLTCHPWESIDCSIICVRMYDLLSKSGKTFNRRFNHIKSAGGIHKYLKFEGEVFLSNVMPDGLIDKCCPEIYAEAVNTLRPEYFSTVDGWTYEGNIQQSEQEIERMKKQTEEVIDLCPDATPVCHVKGANIRQVEGHARWFLHKGFKSFMFHTSDFFRHNRKAMINKAEIYARLIREIVPCLWLYGIGSPTHLERFSFADNFITSTHFTGAFNRQLLSPKRWINSPTCSHGELIDINLKQLYKIVSQLQYGVEKQTSLNLFLRGVEQGVTS